MNTCLIILLRIFHILSGALWFGAAISYLPFFKPSVKAIGHASTQFMQSLTERRKYPVFMISTLQALEKNLSRAEMVDFVMLVIAMLTMATARYWTF